MSRRSRPSAIPRFKVGDKVRVKLGQVSVIKTSPRCRWAAVRHRRRRLTLNNRINTRPVIKSAARTR